MHGKPELRWLTPIITEYHSLRYAKAKAGAYLVGLDHSTHQCDSEQEMDNVKLRQDTNQHARELSLEAESVAVCGLTHMEWQSSLACAKSLA